MLARLRVTVNEDKTRIVSASAGFDFLWLFFNCRMRVTGPQCIKATASLAQPLIRHHLWYIGAMAETPETQLIEALKKVDVYGDIAPPHVQDPMTMVLRQNAIQADLIRWDDSRARFVLTGTGSNRITARSRTSGKILRFKMRDEKDGRAPLRKA